MDTALVVITLLSLGITGALLVYAARLQREHRERENARVASLAAELRLDTDPPPVFREVPEPDPAVPEAPPTSPARRLTLPIVGVLAGALALGGLYADREVLPHVDRRGDAAPAPKDLDVGLRGHHQEAGASWRDL
jgi:hypothetical protein